MLLRKDSTQKNIRIKEQTQNKYDNNITIIIYDNIKLHSESKSSNIMCCIYQLTTCTHYML